MALVTILFLAALYIYSHKAGFVIAIFFVGFVALVFPMAFYPLAFVWLGLSNLLGSVTSRLILLLIYVLVIVPVGLIRKRSNRASMHLHDFKKSNASIMKIRDRIFVKEDFEHTF